MATIVLLGLDEYARSLQRMSKDLDKIIKQSTYPAAGLVADEIKKNVPEDSGELKSSLALTQYKEKDGFVYTTVTFAGYDNKDTPNLLKARVLEHGTSKGRRAAPFIRPAVNRVKKQAEQLIAQRLDEKIKEYMDKE